jgi:hypothetical protein
MIQHIALVSDGVDLSFSDLSQVAAAIQKQVVRDFGPAWDVEATVNAFPRLEDAPPDYWKVTVVEDIGSPAYGYHRTPIDRQPYALVQYREFWSISASHEILELLADPSGDRQIAGQSPSPDQGRVMFLVEVCDPCASDDCWYPVNNWPMSCFYTKHYFDPVASPGVQYSPNGMITEPRQVLRGGYLTWNIPETNEWWQRRIRGRDDTTMQIDPDVAAFGALREAVDQLDRTGKPGPRAKTRRAIAATRAAGARAQEAYARRFRAELARWRKPPRTSG